MKKVCRRINRAFACLLALALLNGLCGCGETEEQTLQFYYRAAEDDTYTDGAIRGETRGADTENVSALLEDYFSGPQSGDLVAPFPRGTQAEYVRVSGGQAELVLSDEFSQLTGISRTLAEACLTLTLTQLDGVDSVSVLTVAEYEGGASAEVLSTDDFALEDTGSEDREERIKIYFADSANRYLMGDQRRVVVSENESTAVYIMQQLLAGPTDEQLQATIPEGTELLSVKEEDGLCTVDLSSEFRENVPKTEGEERMTVYSIVNSLTELETIDRVQILCEGQPIGIYRYLDLSEPYVRNEDTIGPVLSGLNEFDATVYMRSWSPDYLAEMPLRIHQTADQTQEELVIEALLAYEPVNGFTNPIPKGTQLLSEELSNGVCTVTLSHEFAEGANTAAEQRMRVICLVASLTALDSVDAVQIVVDGAEEDDFSEYDISQPLSRVADWFFP